MKQTLELTKTKTTKGTHVYSGPEGTITGIYIPKALFDKPDAPPAVLKLTLEGK